MSENLENIRITLDRMENKLEPGNDEHSELIDCVNHMRDLLQQANKELAIVADKRQ